MAKKKLIIVESKAKTQSIGKIVGDEYKVTHCLGHVFDLPEKELGIDVANGFKPIYKIVPGKNKLIKQLKDDAKLVDEVILATDPDREGESIAWHLARIFPDKIIKRMTFNEITAKAIMESLNNLRDIDQKLVDAQQARRVLDRLVGYKISPLLWRNLNNSRLSAGRVQSVALRLICEKEREIEAFDPQEYWTITGLFDCIARHCSGLDADFFGSMTEEIKITNEEQATSIVNELQPMPYLVHAVQKKTERRRPSPPFITSTLQQEASSRLRFSASKTMSIAQQLYEGIELGGKGSIGLITYMRTDSVRVSADAQEEARKYIIEKFGKSYLPDTPKVYKSKAGAQDAHEAIRPTDITLEPAEVARYLSKDQQQLYELIWSRFLAAWMQSALVDVTRIDISAGEKYIFRASGSVIQFDGFLKVFGYKAKETEQQSADRVLPPLEKGDNLNMTELQPKQHFTKPPARFSEATLVKELEERGIGRPSTYVPTIETLKKRDYVILDKRAFKPTKWGFVVSDLLKNNFADIIDYEFTAHMEENLDSIESGAAEWQKIIEKFYEPFINDIQKASRSMKLPDEKCEKCGGELVIKSSRFGAFLGCANYPACDYTRPMVVSSSDEESTTEPAPNGEKCEKCGADMVIRKGRFGPFLACSAYPKCKNKLPLNKDNANSAPKKEAQPTGEKCEKCGADMVVREGRFGSFIACSAYPKCKNKRQVAGAKTRETTKSEPQSAGEKCDQCGAEMVLRKGRFGLFVACSAYPKCKNKKQYSSNNSANAPTAAE